tara:strand:- start:2239 stop:3381 length:1143 start_codon:yes stop_codon:yes gene_type:complete
MIKLFLYTTLIFNLFGIFLWCYVGRAGFEIFYPFLISTILFILIVELKTANTINSLPHSKDLFVNIPEKNLPILNAYLLAVIGIGYLFFLEGIPLLSENPDEQRFIQRKSPLIASSWRVLYFVFPVVAVIFLNKLELKNEPKISLFITLIIFIGLVLSGSKAAPLFTLIFIFLYYYYFKKFDLLFALPLIAFLISLGIFFAIILTSFNMNESFYIATIALFGRMTLGAGEGYLLAHEYVNSYGMGLGFFTILKPLYTLLGTFRLIPKSDYTEDSGVFIAYEYRGLENNASFTFTFPGLGYLEFGYLGMLFYTVVFAYFIGVFINSFYKDTNPISKLIKLFLIFNMWYLLDWGFIDGFIVFLLLYITIFWMGFSTAKNIYR